MHHNNEPPPVDAHDQDRPDMVWSRFRQTRMLPIMLAGLLVAAIGQLIGIGGVTMVGLTAAGLGLVAGVFATVLREQREEARA